MKISIAALLMMRPRPIVSRIWFCGSAPSTRLMNTFCSSAPNMNMIGMPTTIDMNVEPLVEDERHVHADHEQLAMREVDHAHDAEDHRQTDADQRVGPSLQDSAEQRLQKHDHRVGSPGG